MAKRKTRSSKSEKDEEETEQVDQEEQQDVDEQQDGEEQVESGSEEKKGASEDAEEADVDKEDSTDKKAAEGSEDVPEESGAVTGGGLFSANDVDELMEEEEKDEAAEAAETSDDKKRKSTEEAEGEPSQKKGKPSGSDGQNDEDDEILDEQALKEAQIEEQVAETEENDPALQKKENPLESLPVVTRDDKTLEEVLEMMDDEDFTPIIPDAVTDYYLAKNGFASSNKKIKRLLALATQKFISDIATDAYEYSRIRSNTAVYNSSNPQARARALMMATVMSSQGHGTSDDTEEGSGGNENPLTGSLGSGNNQNQKVTLTMQDLSSALDEYGLNVNRPQFYR